jgi:glucose-6-phosphate 1-epimerase
MNRCSDLNNRFGIKDAVTFTANADGLITIEVKTPKAEARILLQGAQVLSWKPINEQSVVWLSPAAKYVPNKSVRGGIPICWPWFGTHDTQPGFPAHGVARTTVWQVDQVEQLTNGDVRLLFHLPQTVQTGAYWPHVTPLQYSVTIGSSLQLELTTRNESEASIIVGEALHTYFAVSDVREVRVSGLDNCEYLDKVTGGTRNRQIGEVAIAGEVDRIYLDTDAECIIEDSDWQRHIHIQKSGSRSTVVWNPWIDKATKLGDVGDEGYLRMLCVESANAADNVVTIPAGGEHRLWVKYFLTH